MSPKSFQTKKSFAASIAAHLAANISVLGFLASMFFVLVFLVLIFVAVADMSADETTPTTPPAPDTNTATDPAPNPPTTNPSGEKTTDTPKNAEEKLPRENIIYVPYDKFNRTFETKTHGVFVPYEDYKKLWEAAKLSNQEPRKTNAPINSMITEVSCNAKVLDEIVQVESTINIELIKDGWHEIPLRLGDAAITKADINNEPAKIIGDKQNGYKLIVEKKSDNTKSKNEFEPQRLKLVLHFAKGILKSPGRNSVSFQIPQTPLSRWNVVIPEPGVKIDFSPSIANTTDTKSKNSDKQTVFQAFVGSVPEVQIAWTPKAEGATGLDALISTQITQQTIIDEGIYRTSAVFEYTISRATIANLAINLPADQKVVRVVDSNIKKWEVSTKDKIQTIKIDLFEPAKERQTVRFELEKLFESKELQPADSKSSAAAVKLAIPELTAVGVGRQQGILLVRAINDISCESVGASGLLRIDAAELPQNLQQTKWDAAYRIASNDYNLNVAINKVKPRISVSSQVELFLSNDIRLRNFLFFNIENAGVFQLKIHVDKSAKGSFSASGYSGNGYAAAVVDSVSYDDIKGDDKFKLMTVSLSKKAIGRVGLSIDFHSYGSAFDNKKPGETFVLPFILPRIPTELAEGFSGKLMISADESLRINPIEAEGLQPVSIQQIVDKEWRFQSGNARAGFLFAQDIAAFKIQAEKRQPQLTLRELHKIKIENGAVRHNVTFNYNVQFTRINSIRVDLPEKIAKRFHLNRTNNNWRETKILPVPDDVASGYVAFDFSMGDRIIGQGKFDISWEEEVTQPEIGQSIEIKIPKLNAHKQQPADRIWGQIIISKTESIDLGESESTKGLKPIDPQGDIEASERVADAVAAFEFYDEWELALLATRYKLEDVKRTNIELGLIRANLFYSKSGSGLTAQALFKIRSVQQRLEMILPPQVKITEVRLNNKPISLESDSTATFMIPLTSITPDTPFLLDVRYSVNACKNEIVIPSFVLPDADKNNTNTSNGAAIQKAELAVFVPEPYPVLIGYRGNWTKEFAHEKKPSNNGINCYLGVDRRATMLLQEFNVQDDFKVSGKKYEFSAIHPDSNSSLIITVTNETMCAAIFVLLVIIFGFLTVRLPFIKWLQLIIGTVVVCLCLGFILTTFSEYLVTLSGFYLGVLVVLVCRLVYELKAGYTRYKTNKRETTLPEEIAVSVAE
ncbi:MAG: hypothetical protein LBQ66_03275 [Planctomycetaceae bacterium]|nr:hypothetical protein [Planctomycetaceae bacterium]